MSATPDVVVDGISVGVKATDLTEFFHALLNS